MDSSNLAIGMIFLLQTTVGISGNFCLGHYIFLRFTTCRRRPTDLILQHLIIANFLVIVSKGVTNTMAALWRTYFFTEVGCKLVFYVHRVGRGVSIGSTTLLSLFQFITISPPNSRWAGIKTKLPRWVGISSLFCWVLFILTNLVTPLHVTSKWISRNITTIKDLWYCNSVLRDEVTTSLASALLLLPDVLCLGLMLWASSSMVLILYRHKKRVQHLHMTPFPRCAPETRATQSILMLLSAFVSLYTLSCILHACLAAIKNPSLWLENVSVLSAAGFSTISPYILMSQESQVPCSCLAWLRKTPSLTWSWTR
ncbi:vomeronasal type-1 receptor 4-like [Sorex araneus]|uniref:vomeronasal type-1 receptor 4-like n=1 Tax=Sorex araneus TaxID=42254 RepID=UPI002433BC25|nr:vomeronasal type-1 receptor 4-like [Sorex araneus]